MDFTKIEFVSGGDAPSAALNIRRIVFIEGQDVPEERERDGLDAESEHYIGYVGDQPIATARVRHIEEDTAKIERVAVLSDYRGNHYGLRLMEYMLDHLKSRDTEKVVLEAQTYAQAFYEGLGFAAIGDVFEDANIPHIKMVKTLEKSVTDSGKAVTEYEELPDIDAALVAPDIKEQVYGIIERVAAFYKVPAAKIVSHSKDIEISQARKAAVLLCRQSHLPPAQIAACFGGRPSASISRQAKEAAEKTKNNELFAEEITALQEGRPRRDALGDTMEAVAEFYGVDVADVAAGEDYRSARARKVFVTIMAELDYTTHKKIGMVIGRNGSAVAALFMKTKKRLEDDPRLKAEIAYLSDPDESLRPPSAQDILDYR